MTAPRIIMLVELVQDVTVLHPLVRLCARVLDAPVTLLVSDRFRERDRDGFWEAELARLAAETRSGTAGYQVAYGPGDAFTGAGGVVIAASESDVPAHAEAHATMRTAPPGFLRITLQHGYECVGFLHGHGHDLAHGTNVGFAADVLAGWMPRDRLSALRPGERDKLVVTGPTMAIDPPPGSAADAGASGLIAENLQSARLLAPEPFAERFADRFAEFCDAERAEGREVSLRPHPTGLGLARTHPQLLADVSIDAAPTYRAGLGRYGWAISPPSSVIFDLIRSRVPVAVWDGESAGFDTRHYHRLERVGGARSWAAFARSAASDEREAMIERQDAFVAGLEIPMVAEDVAARFARLIAAGRDGARISVPDRPAVKRLLVVTDVRDLALDMGLLVALQPLVDAGVLDLTVVPLSTARCGAAERIAPALERAVDAMLVWRYSGADRSEIMAQARARGVPTAHGPPDAAAPLAVPHLTPPRSAGAQVVGVCDAVEQAGALAEGLAAALDDHPDMRVDLQGVRDVPPALARFGARVVALPPVRPYRALAATLVARGWTIGIAPNGSMADWLTIAASGAAPLVPAGEAEARLGVRSATTAVEWHVALAGLAGDDPARVAAAEAAQAIVRERLGVRAVRDVVDRGLHAVGLRLPASRDVQSASSAA